MTKERLSKFFTDLISTEDYVSLKDYDLRSRDIQNQPDEIKDLLDSKTGAGTRIFPKWFS